VRQAAEEGRKVAFYGRTYKFLFRVPERTRQEKEMTLSIVSKAYRYLDTVGWCFSVRKKKIPTNLTDLEIGWWQSRHFLYPIRGNWSLIGNISHAHACTVNVFHVFRNNISNVT